MYIFCYQYSLCISYVIISFKIHSQVMCGQKPVRPRTQIAVTRHVTVLLNCTVSTDSAHVLQLIICVCRPTCISLQHTDPYIFYLYHTRTNILFWFTYTFFSPFYDLGIEIEETINQLICIITFVIEGCTTVVECHIWATWECPKDRLHCIDNICRCTRFWEIKDFMLKSMRCE